MNKVTLEQIISKIKGETYIVLPDGRTTVCMLTLENGYTIKGLSACVDEAAFELNMGRKIALDDAIRQIWPLEGYLLAEKLYWDRAVPVASNPPVTQEQVVSEFDEEYKKWKTKTTTVRRAKKTSGATRKSTRKSTKAPWGYKADGTPKKRMGRPPKSGK